MSAQNILLITHVCSWRETYIYCTRNKKGVPDKIRGEICAEQQQHNKSVKGVVVKKMAPKANESNTIMLTSGASGRINALFSLRAWKALMMLINAFLLLLLVPFRRRRVSSSSSSSAVASSVSSSSSSSSSEKIGGAGGGKEQTMRLPTTVMMSTRKSSAATAVVDKEVAARRALAIKRVMNDDGGDEEETLRDYSLFVASRGDTMFTQSWTPRSIKPRGLVVILHGLNEHSGRYNSFAKQLNANGYKVYGMDWIGFYHRGPLLRCIISVGSMKGLNIFQSGCYWCDLKLHLISHGGSDGLHAYVHSLDYAVNDMKSFLRKVLAENPGLPCFCFGHSTGAAIILKAVLDPKVQPCISGVVLTSPAVGVQPSHPIFAVLAPVVSFLFPTYQFRAANKMGVVVSRDPKALAEKYSDPLVFTGSIRVRTGYEVLRITAYLQQNLNKLTVPFLVLHGTADAMTDPKASEKLYEEASSTDKTIKLYEGLLHDLLFEPEREEISKDIIVWLNHRLQC